MLYLPLSCKDKGVTKVNPKHAYPKKKDAENHVALLCVKKLMDKGYFDEYILPVYSHEKFKDCIGAQRLMKVPLLTNSK